MRSIRGLIGLSGVLLAVLFSGCAHVAPAPAAGAGAGAGDTGFPIPTQALTAHFSLTMDDLLLSTVEVEVEAGRACAAKFPNGPVGAWHLSVRPDPCWAGLTVLRAEHAADDAAPGFRVAVWLDARERDGKAVVTPVLVAQEPLTRAAANSVPRKQGLGVQLVPVVDGVPPSALPADPALALRWVLADLAKADDPDLLTVLSDYLWHHGDLDVPPGSFNNIIRLHYRILELDPKATTIYTTTAWLLWSKWVSWKLDPLKMPDGKRKVDEALRLLKRGEKANPGDAAYLYDSGTTMMSLARYHRPDIYPFVFGQLRKAEQCATAEQKPLKVRVRLTLGHNYRYLKRWDDAAVWYRKVLELEPENAIATRCLKQVQAGASEGEPNSPPAPAAAK